MNTDVSRWLWKNSDWHCTSGKLWTDNLFDRASTPWDNVFEIPRFVRTKEMLANHLWNVGARINPNIFNLERLGKNAFKRLVKFKKITVDIEVDEWMLTCETVYTHSHNWKQIWIIFILILPPPHFNLEILLNTV